MDKSIYINDYMRILTNRKYSKKTIETYLSNVTVFMNYFEGRDIINIPANEIHNYILSPVKINTQRTIYSPLKILYTEVLNQSDKFKGFVIPRAQKIEKVSIQKVELMRKISSVPNLKHEVILTLTYSLGLRVSELLNIKISNIDFINNTITILNTSDEVNRMSPMSTHVYELLSKYIRSYNQTKYLLNGQNAPKYSANSCRNVVEKYIGKEYSMNTLRNSTAITLFENGTNLKHIQKHLGLKSIKMAKDYVKKAKSEPIKINLPI